MEHVSNFAGALDKDSSDEFMQPTNYRHLENGDIMYNEGEAGGLLVNVKGNKVLELEWDSAAPAIPPFTSTATNPYGASIRIVGVAYIRKDIVLFYADSSNDENIVDLLKYEGNNAYKRISLIYRLELGIRHTDKVHTEARYENEGSIKVYYGTKNVIGDVPIQLSMINVAPDIIDGEVQDAFLQASYTKYVTLPVCGLGAIGSLASSNSPSILEIINGNLKNGAYMYASRYINKGGNKSVWSPLSKVIYLTDSPMNQGSKELEGGKTLGSYDDTNSGKGFKFSVFVNTAYTHIEIARIYYSSLFNTPECYVVKRKRITQQVLPEYLVDTNFETVLDTLDSSEFVIPLTIQAPKTISAKDDILFSGNTKESFFDVDFDTRIYSFNNSRHALLYDETDNLENDLNGTLGNWKATALGYDIKLDCINRTNDLSYDYSVGNNGYKYQSDGVTFGAEGARVKVEFVSDSVPIDSGTSSNFNYNANIDADGWVMGERKVFQKGEIYRFGLRFRKDNGETTPVKWICDLRIPNYYDLHDAGIGNDIISANYTANFAVLYPKFIVDTNGTDAEDLAIEVMYVKRNYEDRTVITEGFGTTLSTRPLDIDWLTNYPNLLLYGHYSTPGGTHVMGSGNQKLDGTVGDADYFGLETPEALFNKNLNLSNKRLDLVGWYSASFYDANHKMYHYQYNAPPLTLNYNTDAHNFWKPIQMYYIKPTLNTGKDIVEDTMVESGSSGYIGGIKVEGVGAAKCGTDFFIGDACTKHYVYAPDFSGYINSSYTLAYGDIPLFKVRQLTVQYGGRGYNSRLVNNYIPAGSLNYHNTNIINISCLFGDTFAGMFEYQRTVWPLTDRDDDNDSTTPPYWFKNSETVAVPLESSINLNFRYDDYFTKLTKGNIQSISLACQIREEGLGYTSKLTIFKPVTGGTAYTIGAYVSFSSLYLYNSVYSKGKDLTIGIPIEDDSFIQDSFDNRIRYSDKKTDGEFYDSWLNFRVLNFKDADTKYGEINHIDTFNDNMFMWQDNAFAHVLVNPRVQTQGQDGVNMILGTGSTLHDINYVSTDMGIQNINEAVKSFSALYWLDNNNKKIYKFSDRLESISDTKNFSSYLNNSIDEDTEFIGVYDLVRDKVFLTIRNSYGGILDRDMFTVNSYVGTTLILSGDTYRVEMQEGLSYSLINDNGDTGEYVLTTINDLILEFEYVSGDTFSPSDEVDMTLYVKYKDSYTILFDEPTSTFRSFESFIPSIYFRGDKEFYSSEDNAILYVHNKGNRGEFYGITYPMIIDVVVNKFRNTNKMYGAVTFINSVFDSVRGMENDLDYEGTENKTVSAIRLIADRIQTPYLDLYTKDGKIITELDSGLSTGNIDSSNYTNTVRTIRDTNGLRLIPYPDYLYNVRNTLNEFRASLPRIDSDLIDQNNRKITELIRGNQVTLRTVYDNSDNDMIKLKSITTYFNTSIDV